jgi:anthranilate synthase component 2
MVRVLIFDNYDSFTYNLVHQVEKLLHVRIDVCKNDETDLRKISLYDKIILSPGPGIPDEAGSLKKIIKEFCTTKSILGVCLGNQAIGEVFGGKLLNLKTVFHGVAHEIEIIDSNEIIFSGLEKRQTVGRYHSWVIDQAGFPDELSITAIDEFKNVMAVRHRAFDVCGIQFHPESILTPNGEKMISNWLFH